MALAFGALATVLPGVRAFAARGTAGHVVFVTDKRVYLDLGKADGLAMGQAVSLSRGGRGAGSCKVDTLAEHQASCTGARARVGDTFRVTAPAKAEKAPDVPRLPPLADADTLRERAAAVAEAHLDKVDFTGTSGVRQRAAVSVSPGLLLWQSQNDAPGAGSYAQQRIDGSIQGVPLGQTGMRFDAAFSAQRWARPDTLARSRPGVDAQFYLWEAEISRRQRDTRTTFAVGRLWPWHLPGLTLLDGVQVGRQNQAQTGEVGIYGGLVPVAFSLAPTTDTWVAGAYGALSQTGDARSTFRLARQEARVGVAGSPFAGTVVEAEGLAQAWLGSFSVGGGGHVRVPAASPSMMLGTAPAVIKSGLDRAFLDLGFRPSLGFGVGLHARYFGSALPAASLLRAESPSIGGNLHAIADVHYEPWTRLGFAGSLGLHRDQDTGLRQTHAAGEVRLPRFFGDTGGVWFGAEAESGWLRGQGLYTQVICHPGTRLRAFARLSFNATQFQTPDQLYNALELGGYLNVEGVVASWLRVRAWALLRSPLTVQGVRPVESYLGSVLGASLTGVF